MTSTKYTLFEDYLRGDISGEDKRKLELVLGANGNEKHEFDIYKTMRKTLAPNIGDPMKEKELKENLEKLRKKYAHKFSNEVLELPAVKKSNNLNRVMRIAASVVLVLFSFAGITSYSSLNYSPKSLAEKNFVTPKYLSGDKSAGSNALSKEEIVYKDAVNAYQAHSYNSSIQLLSTLKLSESKYIREDAEWLTAINTLSLGNEQESRILLQAIGEIPGHTYSENAKQLLKNMDSFFYKIAKVF